MDNANNVILTWDSFRRGDDNSFQALYRQHYIGLINYSSRISGSRELANEMVIETLLTLWDKRERLPHVSNVRSYLLSCVHSTIMQHHRSEKRRGERENRAGFDMDASFDYEDHFIRTESVDGFKRQLKTALNNLTFRQRELLQMRYFLDMDYDEIAERCNITKRTAYNIIFDALNILKKHFATLDTKEIDPDFLALSTLILSFFLVN